MQFKWNGEPKWVNSLWLGGLQIMLIPHCTSEQQKKILRLTYHVAYKIW